MKNYYGKPYYSLDAWCKDQYGHKLFKIALDAGCSCPNRDGTIATGGCIFCSEGGSGEFAERGGTMKEQIERGILRLENKWPEVRNGKNLIAYFQSYTNTYGDAGKLAQGFREALLQENVAGISIGTRPDCFGHVPGTEVFLDIITDLKEEFPEKFIWVELGLQTIHETTAKEINRGYPYEVFLSAFQELKKRQIPAVVHLILGLPGEDEQMIFESIEEMNRIRPFGVKLQLLQVLEGTELAERYRRGEVSVYSKEEYVNLVTDCILRLDPEICIHRVTGDGPKVLLLAPEFGKNKRDVLNAITIALNQKMV